MKKSVLLFVILYLISVVKGQEDKVKVKLSGFVSSEMFFDSRKVVESRDGDIFFYPAPKVLDANGKDVNAYNSFNFINVYTRLRVKTTPFAIWGGKLTALVEGDFLGNSQLGIGQLRLRHAMVKYTTEKSNLFVGHYWHPMFVENCFPATSSWVPGTPGGVVSRNPQIRFTYNFDKKFRASLTALSQLNFKTDGPLGPKSDYIRNSGIPEFDMHLEYGNPSRFLMGIVAGTKAIVPRITNNDGNKVDENIRTYHALAYTTVKTPKMEYKLQGIYAQDGSNLLLLGGYAVSGEDANGVYEYTPLSSFTTWGEVISHYPTVVNFGFFAAYTKNLGAKEAVLAEKGVYGRGATIDKLLRIAPRVVFGYKSFRFMVELNQTYANYGMPNTKMRVKNTDRVGNTRLQLHVKYAF